MTSRRKRVSRWNRLHGFWRTSVYVATGIVALVAATTAVVKVLPYTEAWWFASHAHVDGKVDPVEQKADILMYWRLDDQRNVAKKEEGGWTVQLQKEKDPNAQPLIQKQIDHAKADQKKYDERIKQLKVPDWVK